MIIYSTIEGLDIIQRIIFTEKDSHSQIKEGCTNWDILPADIALIFARYSIHGDYGPLSPCVTVVLRCITGILAAAPVIPPIQFREFLHGRGRRSLREKVVVIYIPLHPPIH